MAKCPYFGQCSGCQLQHVEYGKQLEQKKQAVARATGISDVKIFSGPEYGYRNRMDFMFHAAGLGFRRKDEPSQIVDVSECPIANKRINELLGELRAFFVKNDAFDLRRRTGTLRYAVIRAPENNSSISFVLNEESQKLGEAVEKIQEFAQKTTAGSVVVAYVPPDVEESISAEFYFEKGEEMLTERYISSEFIYPLQGFFQNNHEMAEKMQHYVNELFRAYDTSNAHLLDMYSGVGTFGIINAELFKDVIMIENYAPSIEAANKNIEKNGINNAKATVLDAKKLKRLNLEQPLFVITDPPRSGMDMETIAELNKLKPKAIIYISCNLQQLAKDIPKFKGHTVKSAALFDMFPHTNHSEAVVELVMR